MCRYEFFLKFFFLSSLSLSLLQHLTGVGAIVSSLRVTTVVVIAAAAAAVVVVVV